MEGINADTTDGSLGSVRIGIIGNQEGDCSTPDSWIGIGGNYCVGCCDSTSNPSVGNMAPPTCGPDDHGSQQIAAFGYVFIR